MNEDPRNISYLCEEHAPTPNPELVEGASPEDFIGSFIKAPFKSRDDNTEHMWVAVKSVKDGKLVGLLNSVPQLDHGDLACDDEVTVELNQIEEVLHEQ